MKHPKDVNRRGFLKGLALGTGGAVAWQLARPFGAQLAGTTAAPNLCVLPNGGSQLLGAQDFSYLGHYDVHLNGLDSPYAQALTHRYVDGQLRFLTIESRAAKALLCEWTVAGRGYGDGAVKTNEWLTPWNNDQQISGNWYGLWWDEDKQRLWSTHSIDYGETTAYYPTNIYTRTLNGNGTVSNLKHVSLAGVSSKNAYGGAVQIPLWFQQRYGVGPYAVGFGGYASLMAQASRSSLGPSLFAMPDPAAFPNGAELSPAQFKTLMNCGVPGSDWYAHGRPTSFDRGVRLSHPINYYDGGDPRQNPRTEPEGPPVAGAQWLSPAPDGLGRWTWGDSYWNTGCWIDGPNKQGFVAVATLGAGKVWYGYGQLVDERKVFELHAYDPAELGESAAGTRPVWNVKPKTMLPLTLDGLGSGEFAGQNAKAVAGATYDPVGKRLYLFGTGGGGTYVNRLYVYSVNA